MINKTEKRKDITRVIKNRCVLYQDRRKPPQVRHGYFQMDHKYHVKQVDLLMKEMTKVNYDISCLYQQSFGACFCFVNSFILIFSTSCCRFLRPFWKCNTRWKFSPSFYCRRTEYRYFCDNKERRWRRWSERFHGSIWERNRWWKF